ncbi:AAA family ATPase [Desulfovibrio litoralis]|uniref:Predicted ATPase n=1 Tax=Desulfovibrio litoralis DSM 11393 TaxID=1121455 RepID=A0A1M7TM38_9BACT|nr:DUF3696 domain-containing protein [Desulfovibrio litoralis]SHN71693.1 Predicted ATPase [Desulfovibrio litoralis DSM 11393]
MLKSIYIKGFKCFADNRFDLAPLTVLAGYNSSGKTSFLQILALLHQTACESGKLESLILNGCVVHLGRVSDILSRTHSRNKINIEIAHTKDTLWSREYVANDLTPFNLKVYNQDKHKGKDKDITPLFKKTTYLSADRLGPREMHSLEDSTQYNSVGVRGERAISRIYSEKNSIISELILPKVSPQPFRQLEAYMQKIFPDFLLKIQQITGSNYATLEMSSDNSVGYVRPQNIGFGLSYTLPIYVACLTAKKDDIILLENPEAHLHPSAQSKMGEFLASVASVGVQIIVETHSDHLLNGIRKAVKSKTSAISADNVIIHFFSKPSGDGKPQVISPQIDHDGKISTWPEGFFDQYDKDLEQLIDW